MTTKFTPSHEIQCKHRLWTANQPAPTLNLHQPAQPITAQPQKPTRPSRLTNPTLPTHQQLQPRDRPAQPMACQNQTLSKAWLRTQPAPTVALHQPVQPIRMEIHPPTYPTRPNRPPSKNCPDWPIASQKQNPTRPTYHQPKTNHTRATRARAVPSPTPNQMLEQCQA